MSDNAVIFDNVSRSFAAIKAVDKVSFAVRDGEFFTFLGPSGSGKTTCLRLIAGFERADSGSIFLSGLLANALPPYDRDVHTVFQDYALFPHMNVLDNVSYGLMIKKLPKQERYKKAEQALEMVRLSGLGKRRPAQLSGGQRQRVALARALVGRPKILLLDEPLGALDLKLREQMQVELKELQVQVGITFIYVTHDQEEALSMSDRIAVFNQGKIEQLDHPSSLYDRPKTSFVAAFVGTSNLIAGDLAEKLTGQTQAFSIRPERILMDKENALASSAEVQVSGTVHDLVYLGRYTRAHVRLDEGDLLTVHSQNLESHAASSAFRKGDRVSLRWPRHLMHSVEP